MEGGCENKDSLQEHKHMLNSKWIVWYHNPSDQSWTIDSYKDVLEIDTLEDFFVLKNSWDKCLPKVSEGMFFIMRKLKSGQVIYPQWEDINNRKGGYWSFKIDKENAQDIWFRLCSFTIGEDICNETMESLQVNGISISPKKNFCIIKIWNNNCDKNSISLLNTNLDFLNMEEVMYSSHVKNIERDQTKQKKYSAINYNKKQFKGGSSIHLGRF
uniref:Eukaryotic translation initiation factor 4E n=1 Tax=viral metagenome TaxID=1070528 RepID=A0A6C0JG63_9ZZZZ